MNMLKDCKSARITNWGGPPEWPVVQVAPRPAQMATLSRRVHQAISTVLLTMGLVLATDSHAIHLGIADISGQFGGVGMLVSPANHQPCSGTMLSGDVLLTAAQCVYGLTPADGLQFTLGAGMSAHVTEIRAHPGFSSVDGLNLPYDIALVALNKAEVAAWGGFTSGTVATTASLPGTAASDVGFGETSNGVGDGERRFGAVSISQYIGAESPVGVYLPDAFIETIPANELGQTFCLGDAGGPLISNHEIIGVASFRFVASCDAPGPGYYVNVQRVSGWISENLSAMDAPGNVPEPASLALLAMGWAALGLTRRKAKA